MKILRRVISFVIIALLLTSTGMAQGLLDDLKGYVQEAHCLPFDGSLLDSASFGTPRLRQTDADLGRGVYFVYWVFSKTDEAVIEEVLKVNQEERFFTLSKKTFEGVEFNVLTQYGPEARELWITALDGKTVLFISHGLTTEGLPEPIPALYVPCTYCGGSGSCTDDYCSGGKHTVCNGSGHHTCYLCQGDGKCTYCGGDGMRGSDRCYRCPLSMPGKCQYCRGAGWNGDCGGCLGSGKCRRCNGTDKCSYCGGDGNQGY